MGCQKRLSRLILRMCNQMPAMMHSRPVMSNELCVERVLKRVEMSAKVPIIIRIMPIKGVIFFIKTLNFMQKYEIIMNYALLIMNYFVPLHAK